MTQNKFNHIKDNFSKYEGREVEFTYYIPSADKYATGKGYLRAIGIGCNEGCFIISERNRTHAIYFKHVRLMRTYVTRKRVLAETYVELCKEFDGEYFRPRLTDFNIDWLVEEFNIEQLKWKIECVRNAIQAKKERLAREA